MTEIDILSLESASITAPAGCGKTELISRALARHSGAKPILILTHTNAGVAALRSRLNLAGVSPKSYRLSTIDGWTMQLASMFPGRSRCNPELLALRNPGSDYLEIRRAAARLLQAGHIGDILAATYERLIVDEYQDCSDIQHAVVSAAAESIPTCVLGDPLQAIFGFGGDPLPSWRTTVSECFPTVAELNTPWRWINAGEASLGEWLLQVRSQLLHGESIDLCSAPSSVHWIQVAGPQDYPPRLTAARAQVSNNSGSVLVIGYSRSPERQRNIARRTPGAVTVEAVDMKDLVTFARTFRPSSESALSHLVNFAHSVMTKVNTDSFIRRIDTLQAGRATNPATEAEQAALAFLQTPSNHTALGVLSSLERQKGVRRFRPSLLSACIKALHLSGSSEESALFDAAIRVREQYRQAGRSLPRRAVGSTLLVKGLESDVAVVLDADHLNARNLYVAMTRGSKMLKVCSQTPYLRAN